MTSTNLAGKLHRWAISLQEYDFAVEYRPGNENVVADALSRAPDLYAHGQERQLSNSQIKYARKRSGMVRDLQMAQQYRGKRIKMRQDLVVIEYPESDRIVMPKDLWPMAFANAHDSVWAGHLRAPQTHAAWQSATGGRRCEEWWTSRCVAVVTASAANPSRNKLFRRCGVCELARSAIDCLSTLLIRYL